MWLDLWIFIPTWYHSQVVKHLENQSILPKTSMLGDVWPWPRGSNGRHGQDAMFLLERLYPDPEKPMCLGAFGLALVHRKRIINNSCWNCKIFWTMGLSWVYMTYYDFKSRFRVSFQPEVGKLGGFPGRSLPQTPGSQPSAGYGRRPCNCWSCTGPLWGPGAFWQR